MGLKAIISAMKSILSISEARSVDDFDSGTLKTIRGDKIEPREAHVALVHAKSFIIIHGGLAQNETSQELVAISAKDEKASNIADIKGQSPGMLESHSCVKVNDSYIIYGGIRKPNSTRELRNRDLASKRDEEKGES